MAQMNLAETVRVLKEHFGARVTATQDEGRDMMAQALQDQLGISANEARDAVKALERAHTIRWRDNPATLGTVAQSTMPFGEALGAENPAGPATSAQAPLEPGYWQL